MNHLGDTAAAMARGVSAGLEPDVLSSIKRSDCAATLWQRRLPSAVQVWLDNLATEQLPKARVIVSSAEIEHEVRQIWEVSTVPECAERAYLIDDMTMLVATFAELMRAPFVRLRYDVVTNNACRKFHIDAVISRLICTYRGTGTQFGNMTGNMEPNPIFTVPTGSPFLLRGTLQPEHPVAHLRHRSPPIEGTEETRLVLVLDPMSGPDEEDCWLN